jgi:hypothetical protein
LTTAYAEIVVRVAGKDYSGLDFVNLDAGYTAEQALARAVANALRHLNHELNEAASQPRSSHVSQLFAVAGQSPAQPDVRPDTPCGAVHSRRVSVAAGRAIWTFGANESKPATSILR